MKSVYGRLERVRKAWDDCWTLAQRSLERERTSCKILYDFAERSRRKPGGRRARGPPSLSLGSRLLAVALAPVVLVINSLPG